MHYWLVKVTMQKPIVFPASKEEVITKTPFSGDIIAGFLVYPCTIGARPNCTVLLHKYQAAERIAKRYIDEGHLAEVVEVTVGECSVPSTE